ncbi:MAG: hypothetical protein KDK03_11905 [Rhodobacteraceae bacterium]|nr:hypothetical protein [Paracoccaceae bacterium]
MTETSRITSRGVDKLIAKLRDDGVAAGRDEAARLKSEAEAEAARLLARARAEADSYLVKAKKEADAYRAAGEQALETAIRDAVLRLRAGMAGRFRDEMQRLVSEKLADEEMLKAMILEIVGRARDSLDTRGAAEVILPAAVVGAEQIRENAGDIQSDRLTGYVLGLTSDMLRDGVTLLAADGRQGGIRVRFQEGDIELDLTDEAVAALLLAHMQPRFRAVLEGVIRG